MPLDFGIANVRWVGYHLLKETLRHKRVNVEAGRVVDFRTGIARWNRKHSRSFWH